MILPNDNDVTNDDASRRGQKTDLQKSSPLSKTTGGANYSIFDCRNAAMRRPLNKP
jgi:hypothetical protein